MPTKSESQTAIDEKVVEDNALEELLEHYQDAKDAVGEARGALRPVKAELDTAIEKLDLGTDTAVRIGRFRVTKTALPARSVSFDVAASTRVRIALTDES